MIAESKCQRFVAGSEDTLEEDCEIALMPFDKLTLTTAAIDNQTDAQRQFRFTKSSRVRS
jgi:hypothetical protein